MAAGAFGHARNCGWDGPCKGFKYPTPILPTLFKYFLQGRLGELRSRYFPYRSLSQWCDLLMDRCQVKVFRYCHGSNQNYRLERWSNHTRLFQNHTGLLLGKRHLQHPNRQEQCRPCSPVHELLRTLRWTAGCWLSSLGHNATCYPEFRGESRFLNGKKNKILLCWMVKKEEKEEEEEEEEEEEGRR